jgi:Na+/proline symporter
LRPFDWVIVGLYSLSVIAVGLYFRRKASRSPEDFFVGGRSMPWWLIGLADVASYGAAGAPWVMLFYLGGFNEFWLVGWVTWCVWMPLVAVVWAKMWRRLGVVTTAEFIERRYSGRAAASYRVAYAFYAYAAWAVVLLANVVIWFTESISPILGWSASKVVFVFGTVAILYTLLSGFYGVVWTELIQFFLIMGGTCAFAFTAIHAAGGLTTIYAHVLAVRGAAFLSPFPGAPLVGWGTLVALLVQGLFFAGSPFAGEGWTAQRAMSARNENHAVSGQMLNCILTLVVRIIPALLVGLAVVVLYPTGTVKVPAAIWARAVHDYAPLGMLGVLCAGAVGAFMASISTAINWGTSYLVNDVYRRHLRPNRSQREYALASRILTVATLIVSFLLGLAIDPRKLESWVLFTNSALIVFGLPLAWLKWFWWRTNVYGEAVGTLGSFPLSYILWFGSDAVIPRAAREFVHRMFGWNLNGLVPAFGDMSRYPFWYGFTILFAGGWIVILLVTCFTRPEPIELLRDFYIKVRPPGVWGPVVATFDRSVGDEIKNDAWRNVKAGAWGIGFCFAMTLAVFCLIAGQVGTSVIAALATAISGYLFRKGVLAASERNAAGIEAINVVTE